MDQDERRALNLLKIKAFRELKYPDLAKLEEDFKRFRKEKPGNAKPQVMADNFVDWINQITLREGYLRNE